MSKNLEVVCPCCRTKLTLEAESGEILAQDRPKVDSEKSFEQAMSAVRSGSQKREDAFTKAVDRTRRLDELLEKKFEEARKKAKDDPDRPVNPLDLD